MRCRFQLACRLRGVAVRQFLFLRSPDTATTWGIYPIVAVVTVIKHRSQCLRLLDRTGRIKLDISALVSDPVHDSDEFAVSVARNFLDEMHDSYGCRWVIFL
ncbi:MAG: hypothetical protein ACI8XO_002597 [Verrucomicrobiales bacterium]|jgi:hypothetical protein